MGKDNRDRISVDLGGGLRERIHRIWKNPMFNFENFKFVPVVRAILLKGVEWYEQESKRLNVQTLIPSIADLISDWELQDLSDQTTLDIAALERLKDGEYPTDEQLIDLGVALNTPSGEPLDTHQLMEIRKRDFPNGCCKTQDKGKNYAR